MSFQRSACVRYMCLADKCVGSPLGTADDFSNLNVFQQNLRCRKEKLQLSNATNFSSIRQETTKLQGFKVERFADKFVTVTTGKDPVRRHKRLDFPPDNRFICIHWQCMSPAIISLAHGGAKIRRFASFRLAVLTSTGPLFWFVWT